jgi:hypothetical protein
MVTLTLHPGCRDSTPESDMSRKTGNGTVAQPINQRREWTDADRPAALQVCGIEGGYGCTGRAPLGPFTSMGDILRSMRSKFPRTLVGLVLAVCFVCPIIEMFDYWDHTIQTGSDTEYALVLLALCVGMAFSFARFIKLPVARCVSEILFTPVQIAFLSAQFSFTSLLFYLTTPPPLEIRI